MMNESFMVSVLVPVYKVAGQIEHCAKSLFEQTFDSIEYIFADDASPDESMTILNEVLARYPHRKNAVRIIRHVVNQGLGKTRADLLAAATGKYIFNCDSDDYISADMIEKSFQAAEKENADIVSFNFRDVFSDGTKRDRTRNFIDKESFIKNLLSGAEMPYIWLFFCKRDLYVKNNIFPVPHVDYGEDYATSPRLLFVAKKIVFLPDILYFYRHDNQDSYCNRFRSSYLEERDRVYEEFERFWGTRFREELKINKIREKCNFYRLYALAKDSKPEDLSAINAWHAEISFFSLLKEAQLPYIPVILLAYMRMLWLLRMYARFCKGLYHLLTSRRRVK